MAPSREETTLPATRRPRKSTGHSPVRKRMEKENITVDVASSLAGNGGRKKSRSKSMGPGGIDVLKSGNGNRRSSLAAPARPPPRSILKPTIPIVPEIPPHKSKSSGRNAPPHSLAVQGTENLPNPFQTDDPGSSGTKIALRTEEEQQAAAREREEKEKAQMEKEINDRREARRKSLANRRVSFAAEATLHTFHEIEYMQDSTTSTDSTRRASSVAGQSSGAAPANQDPSDPPSTPPEQADDLVPESPDDQRDLHQKKRRRSSGAASMGFNQSEDETMVSSLYSSDSEGADGVIEAHEDMGSDSDSDSADGVTMDLDVDEVTGTSIASAATARSGYTLNSDGSTLDDALRLAASRAVTQSLDEEEEIIPSFGWARKPAPKQEIPARGQENQAASRAADDEDQDDGDMDMDMDMDMTNAVGGIIKSHQDEDNDDMPDEEMSMDVTHVLGGILPQRTKQPAAQLGSPDKVGEESGLEEATMEFTTAMGGIRQGAQPQEDLLDFEEDEDMSMELTSVIGRVLPGHKPSAGRRKSAVPRRRTLAAADDEATMDMTTGMGRIISNGDEDADEVDATMGMEMTTAIGGIIQDPSPARERTQAKHLMEEEVNKSDSAPILNSASKRRLSQAVGATAASETESPGLSAFRGKGLRHSTIRAPSASPRRTRQASREPSPPKSSSPLKAGTPQSQIQSSPLKTPPSKKTPQRGPSPKRPAAPTSNSTPKSAQRSARKLFQVNPSTGASTPQIVLTPQNRRLSGLGADKAGLGSPKVAELLERRGSIGEAADNFIPSSARGNTNTRGVTFADPRVIEDEINKERWEDADKEDGRSIMEREADAGDDENNTATLKDMISSMTPKKNPLRGRKSLHVGSASGLLGKRPAELDDEDDDAEERDGVKRLKGHQSSPVKNVRLHAPPTKAETTGRLSRSTRSAFEEADANTTTPTLSFSAKKGSRTASSPHGKGRFRDVESDQATNTINFEEAHHAIENPDANVDEDGDRIHLQDFLNMTNIRFMELTTTKRRHTQLPPLRTSSGAVDKEDLSLERCVVAGACTVPMLELYQHSCRELKKYISEGRRIVREIETETFEENPPLFKEYMSAAPEFKLLMDSQFKNVKTHARLLSKAMWYEWRSQLQEGLREGLVKIAEGMDSDEQLLQKEQKLLDAALPGLAERFEALRTERDNLEAVARELADCDPEDLQAARTDLAHADADIRAKMQKIEELRGQLDEAESAVGDLSQKKRECLADIEEAEKIREECRGWTSMEITSLKAKVEGLERQHGWAITGIADTTISLTYQREIELVLDISSFQGGKPNSRIDLWYIGANREHNPEPSSPEKEFFIQCIRDHIRGLNQSQTRISKLLKAVGGAWRKANHVAHNIRLLDSTFRTNVARTSDASVAVRSTLLLAPLQTKVEVTLSLHAQSTPSGLEVALSPQAQVVYGEHFKIDKVVEYLATRLGGRVVTKDENPEVELWSDVLVELHDRLVARGKK